MEVGCVNFWGCGQDLDREGDAERVRTGGLVGRLGREVAPSSLLSSLFPLGLELGMEEGVKERERVGRRVGFCEFDCREREGACESPFLSILIVGVKVGGLMFKQLQILREHDKYCPLLQRGRTELHDPSFPCVGDVVGHSVGSVDGCSDGG